MYLLHKDELQQSISALKKNKKNKDLYRANHVATRQNTQSVKALSEIAHECVCVQIQWKATH